MKNRKGRAIRNREPNGALTSVPLKKTNILLGVTGGIAAYKGAELVRRLIKSGASVQVVMTENATRLISPVTFEALSQRPVHTELWDKGSGEIDHVALSARSDLFLIAPATANTVGKITHGLADNLLTNLFLTFRGTVMVCPSMNSNMYLNPAVQANLEILRSRNIHVMEPASGELACGDEGIGRFPDPGAIVREVEFLLKKKSGLSGKKVLVTAGPTREFSDPVRFISNPSSGKMGYALAEVAAARGAEVLLISGPVSLPKPTEVHLVNVTSAEEMNQAVLRHMKGRDLAIMAAAVSDYKPAIRAPGKTPKAAERVSLELERTPDILEGIGKKKKGLFLVGFAAETDNLVEKTREKMVRKNCDMMIGNWVGRPQSGFESDTNEVIILSRKGKGVDKLPLMSKKKMAEAIIEKIIEEMKK